MFGNVASPKLFTHHFWGSIIMIYQVTSVTRQKFEDKIEALQACHRQAGRDHAALRAVLEGLQVPGSTATPKKDRKEKSYLQ